MRRLAVVALLLCFGGASLVVVRLVLSDGAADGHETPAAGGRPEARPTALVEEQGVAEAPDFEEFEPPEETEEGEAPATRTFFWTGVAFSLATKQRVVGAAVVLERLEDGAAWAQGETLRGGRFLVQAPPDALDGRALRVVIESDAGELGLAAAVVNEGEAGDLGRVFLRGKHRLDGRTETVDGEPMAGARLSIRAFGTLRPRSGRLASATSDELGEFTFDRLPEGMFVVEGSGPEGRRLLMAPVVVPSATIVLRPLAAAPLALTVRDTLLRPVVQAKLEVVPQGPSAEQEPFGRATLLSRFGTETGTDGTARIDHVPPSAYLVHLETTDGAAFEFLVHHAAGVHRALTIPAKTDLPFFFIEAPPPPARIPKPPPPLRETRVLLEIVGRSDGAGRRAVRTLTVVTDREGIAFVPRIGATSLHVKAEAASVSRAGEKTVVMEKLREGAVTGLVMVPAELPTPAEPSKRSPEKRKPRSAVVRTAAGLPVKGAQVSTTTSSRRRRTGEEGRAALGPAPDTARALLYRPDLASGDPRSARFGERPDVELTWNEGREIEVRVFDGENGFRLDREVRLAPRPRAWRRIEPGVFRTRYDAATASGPLELRVSAAGYESWTAAPPAGDGPLAIFDVNLLPPLRPPTARLVLEVLHRSVLRERLWVRAVCTPRGQEGAREFVAVTGARGRVELDGLAEGRWTFTVDGGAMGWTIRRVELARGVNPISIHLDAAPAFRGDVVDDRGRPLAGAAIFPSPWKTRLFGAAPPMASARSDGRGRFTLNLRPPHGAGYPFVATLAGHREALFVVNREAFESDEDERKPIVLPRLGAIDLPLQWDAGSAAPSFPADLEFETEYTVEIASGKRRSREKRHGPRVHVVNGRLAAGGIPPGWLRFRQRRGAAWVREFRVEVKPGTTTRTPAVKLRNGASVEGKIVREAKPAAGAILSLRAQGVSRTVIADERGRFRCDGLAPGWLVVLHPRQTAQSVRRNRRIVTRDRSLTTLLVELRGE